MSNREEPRRGLNLALQGGGSHGAFTWGVLDALLEDGRVRLDGVSGTSAGAMNAVVMAHGLMVGGPDRAREDLARFWGRVGEMGAVAGLVPFPLWEAGRAMANAVVPWLSPYNSNPLNLNPLRDLLGSSVDFERLAAASGPRLFICATRVSTGRARIFTGAEVTLDAVMASACLPQLFKAVEIDGEAYWDGGYSGNPALFPLVYETHCDDILLVQINPVERVDLPDSAHEIADRVNEVTFNAPLLAELRAIEFVRRLLAEGRLDPGRYKSIRMHRVDGGEGLASLGASSKHEAKPAQIERMHELGREAARQWLAAHWRDIGHAPSLDIERFNQG